MEILGILAAILSAASWACGTLLFDRIGKVMSPAGITFVKGAAGILLMALLAVCLGGFDRIEPMDGLYLALSGIIGIAVGDTLFFKSLQDLGAKMQVLFFMLGQVMTMLLSFLFLGELLSVNEYVGSFALLLGVVIVLWGKQEDHPNKARGILYGLLAIGCFSLSAVIVKYSIHDVDVVSATFYRMSFGTVFILLAGLTSKEIKTWVRPLRDVRLSVLFLVNVLIITFGGFLLSMVAIKNISVSLASVLGTTEPIFVLLFAYLFNHDTASRRELVGALVSVLAVIFIILYG